MQIVIGEPDGGTTLTGYVGDQMVTSRGDFGEFVFDLPLLGTRVQKIVGATLSTLCILCR